MSLFICVWSVRLCPMMAPIFKCVTCKESFDRLTNLRRHAAVHQNIDSCHECQHCDFISRRKDNVKRHIANYHNHLPTGMPVNEEEQQCFPRINDDSVINHHIINPSTAVTLKDEQVTLPVDEVYEQTSCLTVNPMTQTFDKRFLLPHNFLYIGATQSVSFVICLYEVHTLTLFAGKNFIADQNIEKCQQDVQSCPRSNILFV